nr:MULTISPECIES: hypothetical protein [unclassified Pseudomonas]
MPLDSGELLTLLVSSFSYGLYALMPAMAMLRVRRIRVSRTTLREPLYIQCYLASPLSIVLIAANLLAGIQVAQAMLLTTLACIWYLFSQIALLRRLLDLPLLPATFIAISRFIVATLIILALMDLPRSTPGTHIGKPTQLHVWVQAVSVLCPSSSLLLVDASHWRFGSLASGMKAGNVVGWPGHDRPRTARSDLRRRSRVSTPSSLP